MKVALSTSLLSVSILTGVWLGSGLIESHQSGSISQSSVEMKTVEALEFAKAWTSKPVFQSGPNCFGTTLAAMKVIPAPRFATDLEVREFIKSCQPVKTPARGDVGLLYDRNSGSQAPEVHSFIVVDAVRSFYKNGLEASGGFLTAPTAKMFRDFNTGASQATCDRIASNSFEETGVPCPTSVQYFRCSNQFLQRAERDFSKSELVAWTHLQELDLKFSEAGLSRLGPNSSEMQAMTAKTSVFIQAVEQLSLKEAKFDSQFDSLARLRLESFITFLSYYSDGTKWPRDGMKQLKEVLTKAKSSIISYRMKVRS